MSEFLDEAPRATASDTLARGPYVAATEGSNVVNARLYWTKQEQVIEEFETASFTVVSEMLVQNKNAY